MSVVPPMSDIACEMPAVPLPPGRSLCVVGPTAAGKSHFVWQLAAHHPIEIISIDSAQVYRGMDIGTAKPDRGQQQAVAHHLIDLIEPNDHYDAARCRQDTLSLIAQIRDRGRQPVLVGGTLLYVKALLEGLDDVPVKDAALRVQLTAIVDAGGLADLYAELQSVDPDSAARFSPNDRQRIQRAIEVYRLSGQTLSSFQQGAAGQVGADLQLLSIEPGADSRALLKEKIAQRWDAMMAQGFLDEVRKLRARGDLHADMPSMRCVGYRQAWAHLEGQLSATALREQALAATRQLAKRQLTWLRRWPQRWSIDPFTASGQTQLSTLGQQIF